MHAAVVRSFDELPQYGTFEPPVATGDHEVVVDVLAVGLHPRVRSGADGTHYTSEGTLPMIPGVDGVGRAPGGELLYFVASDEAPGTMADRALVDRRRSIELPAGTDPVAIAAAMNPGMSSWVALRRRVGFQPGGSVLVLGATGNAGQLAVQVARHLGAARVVGAGRDAARLALVEQLGADEVVNLGDSDADEQLGRAAGDVDVVVDYLWGAPTERAMTAVLTARSDRSRALDWVQIGSMAGREITFPSYLLRAANLRVMGSGQGSVTAAGIVAELPGLAALVGSGELAVDALPVPLADVESAWTMTTRPGQRVVLVP